jgi:negative regulator of flagellin synthesis FlgM
MRVNQAGNNPVQNTEVTGAKRTDRGAKVDQTKRSGDAPAALQTDVNADISTRGKDFAKAQAVASGAPDVREEKIAELKKRIAQGGYKIDTDAIADRMVDEHLGMHGIG